MRLESALLFQKKDIDEDHFHIEHGKAVRGVTFIYLIHD